MTVRKKKPNAPGKKQAKRTPNKGKKATKEQAEAIVNEIVIMLSNFKTVGQIAQYCADKWGIGERQTYTYIERARALLIEQMAETREHCVSMAVQRLQGIKAQALRKNNLNVVLGAEKEINRILLPTRHELSGVAGEPIRTEVAATVEPIQISPGVIAEAFAALKDAGALDGAVEDDE